MAIFHVFSLSDCILLVSWFLPHRLWLRWSGYSSWLRVWSHQIKELHRWGGVSLKLQYRRVDPKYKYPSITNTWSGFDHQMEPFPCCPVSQLRALKRSLVVNHQSFQSQLSSSKRGVQGTNFPALQTLGFTTCHHSTLLWPLVLAHFSVFSHYYT